MSETSHRVFFGDAEQTFSLTPTMIAELEATTGAGIGGLFKRMIANDFRHREIAETIRLALIGGDMPPETASRLVATYIASRPLVESYGLAVDILSALMFGKPSEPAGASSENVAAAMAEGDAP